MRKRSGAGPEMQSRAHSFCRDSGQFCFQGRMPWPWSLGTSALEETYALFTWNQTQLWSPPPMSREGTSCQGGGDTLLS